MKKLIGTVAVAALLATAAFAEGISFGSWGRGLFIVGNGKSADHEGSNSVTSWIGQSWGGPSPRTALGISGSSDNMGFNLDLHGNGDGLQIGDNALIWAKPVDAVKIVLAAKNDQNWLRNDLAAYGLWGWDRLGCVDGNGEGFVFPAILNKNLAVSVTPIEGLFIGFGFNTSFGNYDNTGAGPGNITEYSYDSGNRLIDQLGRTSAFAASYTLANIGTIKAGVQFQGKKYNKDGERKDRIEIDAAFEFNAIETVKAAIGAKIPLIGNYNTGTLKVAGVDTTVYSAQPIELNLAANLNFIDNLTIHFISGFKFNAPNANDLKQDGALGFMIGGGADYGFSNGLGVFADVRYASNIYKSFSTADKKDNLVFGAGVTKGFSNGVIGVAFEGSTNANGRNVFVYEGDLAWEIPVKFEYWF